MHNAKHSWKLSQSPLQRQKGIQELCVPGCLGSLPSRDALFALLSRHPNGYRRQMRTEKRA